MHIPTAHMKRCLPSGKVKIKRFTEGFSICSKPTWLFWLIHQLLASIPTLHLIHYHLEQSHIGQLPPCNNIWIGRYTPANAQAMKSVNYLHLQMEQLLEACKKFLRENKIKILSNYWVNITIKLYLKYICLYYIIRIKSVMLLYYQCFIINTFF